MRVVGAPDLLHTTVAVANRKAEIVLLEVAPAHAFDATTFCFFFFAFSYHIQDDCALNIA